MKNKKRTIMISILATIFCISVLSNTVIADPTVDEISINPTSPTPKSTVTITADVSGDNLEEVKLRFKECNDVLCHRNQNLSMTLVDGSYQASYTLESDDSTYVEYWLEIKSEGSWYKFEDDSMITNLDRFGNSGSTTDDADDSNKSPGFEIVLVFLSFLVIFFVYKKR